MGSARSSSSMTHPSPKGPLFVLTQWQCAVRLSAYSRWGRTPRSFAVALNVCCSSRSMHHHSLVDAVIAAMLTSGTVFPVLSEVWPSCALEWEMGWNREDVKVLLDTRVPEPSHKTKHSLNMQHWPQGCGSVILFYPLLCCELDSIYSPGTLWISISRMFYNVHKYPIWLIKKQLIKMFLKRFIFAQTPPQMSP